MEQLPDLSQLTSGEKDSLIGELFAIIQALRAQVQALTARVRKLEGQLIKNSKNSSKPPSSDGLKKTTSQRKPSGKKPGGQQGHEGKTLQRVETPDVVVAVDLPRQCDVCGIALDQKLADVDECRQVIDIPVVKFEVTEFQTLSLLCACGKMHFSEFPQWVGEAVQYGPNIQALSVHLTQGQLLPVGRTGELLHDLYGLNISPATILAWIDAAAERVGSSVEAIKESVQAAPVVGADESGLRVDSKLQWLHAAVTPLLTWYGVHAKRGMEAILKLDVLPNCTGRLVHDCFAPYWNLVDQEHSLCGAHLLRELAYEQQLSSQSWAQELATTLVDALKACDAGRTAGATALSAAEIETFTGRYRSGVQAGLALNPAAAKIEGRKGRTKQSSAFNLLQRLEQHETEVLYFMHDLAVPFTNNLSERAFRLPKSKQRVSGCFRTFRGAQNFCTIRSYIDSARKQGIGMLHALQAAFAGAPLIFA